MMLSPQLLRVSSSPPRMYLPVRGPSARKSPADSLLNDQLSGLSVCTNNCDFHNRFLLKVILDGGRLSYGFIVAGNPKTRKYAQFCGIVTCR